MQVSLDTKAERPTQGLTEVGTTCDGTGNICGRRRREPLGGSGGMLPPRIFKSESLETIFPALSG